MSIWIVKRVDFYDNVQYDVIEDFECAWSWFAAMEEMFGDNNVTIKEYEEVKQ